MDSHFGYCNKCSKLAPAGYEERAGQVLLVKQCPDCGRTETIVSTDPARWHAKREIDRLESDSGCKLNCLDCSHTHTPTTVFVDITNRCNQDCPICIANIPGMGFKFEPPLEYFEKVFRYLAALTPRPSIKLFGGEPTVRRDLIELVACAHRLGLSTSVVTNGIRLADEAYCRRLLATGVNLIFSFDGRAAEVYEKLRGDRKVYAKKLKALDNVCKYSKGRVIIMCVVAKRINDHLIGDLVRLCHERSNVINALEFIPLTRTWAPGTIEADGADITAMEDVEKIVAAGVPGRELEFLPAGMSPFKTISQYLPTPRLTFAGAHPNCESVSFLVSNGEEYLPATNYLKGKSLYAAMDALMECDRSLGERMECIRKGILGKLGLTRFIGRALSLKAVARTLWKHVDKDAVFGKCPGWKLARIGLGLLLGRNAAAVLRANTRLQDVLLLVVLPFEETRTLDSARLIRCPAAFAYEDPDTREVKTMPVCTWGHHKDDILRRIMEIYSPGQAVQDRKHAAIPSD